MSDDQVDPSGHFVEPIELASDDPGYRWAVAWVWDTPSLGRFMSIGGSARLTVNGEAVELGDPAEYLVVHFVDHEQVRGRFGHLDDAKRLRDRLNREDAQRDLDPAFAGRRERLRALGETFSVAYGGTGHPDSRWPSQPGRYAVCEWSERYGESFWDTVETREEVEERIRDESVGRVVDLDTADDVPFTVTVKLGA